jgi:hypothetical protein
LTVLLARGDETRESARPVMNAERDAVAMIIERSGRRPRSRRRIMEHVFLRVAQFRATRFESSRRPI